MLPRSPLCFLPLLAAAQTEIPTPSFDINRYPSAPQETTCGDIVHANLYEDQFIFLASDIFDCLTSVPFNSAVALRYLGYLNQTYQYHATTAFVRNPPTEYRQDAFDFFAALQETVDRVNSQSYHNQYAFETAVQVMIRNLHDTHAFVYGDGSELPKLYVYDDLVAQVTTGARASAIANIHGMSAMDYVTSFAQQQSFGMVEPHTDWNQMMCSPAQDLFGLNSFSEAAPFYPGDQLTLTFENGSTVEDKWYALFGTPGFTGPLATGGDFYNFFVLGQYPANYNETWDDYYSNRTSDEAPLTAGGGDSISSNLTSWNGNSPAYPSDTISYQQDLGLFTDGALTGYFLAESSTAVLSLPTFEQYGDAVDTFSQAVTDFINNATQRKATNVIIDLQQNPGGAVPLAFSTFDSFFPNARPFSGSRMRSHHDANVLGQTFTSKAQTLGSDLSNENAPYVEGSEWTVTNRINAVTGSNFTSWGQYSGPQNFDGDTFFLVQQYDLSNPTFVEAAFEVDAEPCFYSRSCNRSQPWDAANIIVLTDGICGSTCSLFVEMMRERGVRSVALGGRPESGPMQVASGSRGAVSYSGDELHLDYADAIEINATAGASLPTQPPDTGIQGIYTGFTLRDQVQKNQSAPNQVLYLPADCRLYWTFANFYNYTRLWLDVHQAMFVDASLCVTGSRNATAPTTPPPSTKQTRSVITDHFIDGMTVADENETPTNDTSEDLHHGVRDDGTVPFPKFCDYTSRRPGQCDSGTSCRQINFACQACTDGSCPAPKPIGICVSRCYNGQGKTCPGLCQCKETAQGNGRTQNAAHGGNVKFTNGYCDPIWSDKDRNRVCNTILNNNLANLLGN
ncbi:peptidase s41 family [Lecanosticta acicola]|uniref:Peptidase s41 family n=1 Tax=Lecanosticta acicola TaxID=111012 RepID=A0AAI8Z9S6_9PEZI|nr:peptidase s41 family [Lecanosticta acicola]